jgi:hypothetical protein
VSAALILIDCQRIQVMADLLCELQRDWLRTEAASEFAQIVFAADGQ